MSDGNFVFEGAVIYLDGQETPLIIASCRTGPLSMLGENPAIIAVKNDMVYDVRYEGSKMTIRNILRPFESFFQAMKIDETRDK